MDAAKFLKRYWQKRPCLIRAALPISFLSFTRGQIFTLACRRMVESRLVLERGGDYPWQVIHGPQRRQILKQLPQSHWTVLVQHADLHLGRGAELLNRFSFIPNWRVDDLMLSFAPAGGGIGPHVDSYDVFLVQATGRRRWQVSSRPCTAENLIPGLDLRILADFRPDVEWVLEPGDMLYLPPGIAHSGIALEDCITASVGFRAPTPAELLARFVDDLDPDSKRFRDPGRLPAIHPGELTDTDLCKIRELLRNTLKDDRAIDVWFARWTSELPEPVHAPCPAKPLRRDTLRRRLKTASLEGVGARRIVYINDSRGIMIFINGHGYSLPKSAREIAESLGEGRPLSATVLERAAANNRLMDTLCNMVNDGALAFRRNRR